VSYNIMAAIRGVACGMCVCAIADTATECVVGIVGMVAALVMTEIMASTKPEDAR
jgi:hypothetical protein